MSRLSKSFGINTACFILCDEVGLEKTLMSRVLLLFISQHDGAHHAAALFVVGPHTLDDMNAPRRKIRNVKVVQNIWH